MDVCALLVAHTQPSVLVQPRECPLDYLSLLSEAAAVCVPTLTDQRLDQSGPQLLSMTSRIIASVTQECVWPPLGPTPFAADGGNRIHQREQLPVRFGPVLLPNRGASMLALLLPDEIEERLDSLAKRTGRSKSYYAREASKTSTWRKRNFKRSDAEQKPTVWKMS